MLLAAALPADAYGLVLRHAAGWSLVYSGDTQPCQQLVQVGGQHLAMAQRARCWRQAGEMAWLRPPARRLAACPSAVRAVLQAGQGCTLLIHEATFEPCLEQQARQKRHSTTAEALAVAQVNGLAAARALQLLPPAALSRPMHLAIICR